MNIRYRVELSQAEREQLLAMLSGGKHPARKLKRAQILLAAGGGIDDAAITRSVAVSGSTVYRTKRRFVISNLDAALNEEAAVCGAQAVGQTKGTDRRHRLRRPAQGTQALDAGTAGRHDGAADRA